MPGEQKLKTTPLDPRFPNTNQTQHCWYVHLSFPMACLVHQIRIVIIFFIRTKYNEWVLCLKKTDGDEDACAKARSWASSICPIDWVGSF